MARMNTAPNSNRLRTFNQAPARALTPEQTLERSIMACMLWEDQFYESGKSIAARIAEVSAECDPRFVADLAVKVRSEGKLRHAPLLLLYTLTVTGAGIPKLVQNAIANTIQRADELTEFLALYWSNLKDGKRRPLSAGVKKGLARAIQKFDAYQLAKYNRDAPVKLTDVLNMVHAKPSSEAQGLVFKGLFEKTLKNTKTWEAKQSKSGQRARQIAKDNDLSVAQTEALVRESAAMTWTSQLESGQLGYDALLKNLRNMLQAGVDQKVIGKAIVARKGAEKTLPGRFVVAMRHAPSLVPYLDVAFKAALADLAPLAGRTAIVVDVSGSMQDKLSENSELLRFDAAAALAVMFPGKRDIFTFSERMVRVPEADGLYGIDRIIHSQPHGGTNMGAAVAQINTMGYDRIVFITDEQSSQAINPPAAQGYIINLASYEAAVGEVLPPQPMMKQGRYGALLPRMVEYSDWTRITGYSEHAYRFMSAYERGGLY
jgi:60 kDa SS-A/Ro ribonucleoprotein